MNILKYYLIIINKELDKEMVSVDPLKFKDKKTYVSRLKEIQKKQDLRMQ